MDYFTLVLLFFSYQGVSLTTVPGKYDTYVKCAEAGKAFAGNEWGRRYSCILAPTHQS